MYAQNLALIPTIEVEINGGRNIGKNFIKTKYKKYKDKLDNNIFTQLREELYKIYMIHDMKY